MADVLIKSVPEGAEESVKNLAMVAIERFLSARDVKVAEQTIAKFETDVDTIREANGLTKKFEKPEEPKDPNIIEEIIDNLTGGGN